LTLPGPAETVSAVKAKARKGPLWDEMFGEDGAPREIYRPLLDRVLSTPRGEIRTVIERLEAAMREMGVNFDISRGRQPWSQRPWFCDVLPELFGAAEWAHIALGLRQRLRAFELFLQDIHGPKEILRSHVIPAQPVLGSPYFQRAAVGLPLSCGAFLHLAGFALARLPDGRMAVTHHYFSDASGISYMMQDRRALSRVFGEVFQDHNPQSIADVPLLILEALCALAPAGVADPVVALLTPGSGNPAYSEHSFLARRMGIPLVQGGDLLVLDDRLYLKSVSGLEKIDVLYTRVADAWLDPLVFRRDSLLGVPGLVQCVRRGNVAVANAIGTRLADDRAILPFSARIIRFYLGEAEKLPTLRTWWLGDVDQRDHVLDNLDEFDIRPLYGEQIVHSAASSTGDEKKLRKLLAADPKNYVAQPRDAGATSSCLDRRGALDDRRQDHIVFALRGRGGDYEAFPGALTRISPPDSIFTASELGGGGKDTWVLSGSAEPARPRYAQLPDHAAPSSHVTSRVADSFYWLGRYLERAYSLACMVGVVESLETEELTRAERQLYRPVWNRMLPPLEQTESGRRRSITTVAERYQIVLDPREEGSLLSTLRRAWWNARQVGECLSIEASGALNQLEEKFNRARFKPSGEKTVLALATQRLCAETTAAVAEFFGLAESTMLSDRGWNFCRFGQQFERAAVTCNAGVTVFKSLAKRAEKTADGEDQPVEIELSAFLRMLASRDAYHRIYQMRAEPVPVLRMLYDNDEVPRSVRKCLAECARFIGGSDSPSGARASSAVAAVTRLIDEAYWEKFFPAPAREAAPGPDLDAGQLGKLVTLLESINDRTHEIHEVVTDSFINHQLAT